MYTPYLLALGNIVEYLPHDNLVLIDTHSNYIIMKTIGLDEIRWTMNHLLVSVWNHSRLTSLNQLIAHMVASPWISHPLGCGSLVFDAKMSMCSTLTPANITIPKGLYQLQVHWSRLGSKGVQIHENLWSTRPWCVYLKQTSNLKPTLQIYVP